MCALAYQPEDVTAWRPYMSIRPPGGEDRKPKRKPVVMGRHCARSMIPTSETATYSASTRSQRTGAGSTVRPQNTLAPQGETGGHMAIKQSDDTSRAVLEWVPDEDAGDVFSHEVLAEDEGTAELIVAAIERTDPTVLAICERGQREHTLSLEPGATVPEFDKLDPATDEAAAEVAEEKAKLVEEIAAILEDDNADWQRKVSASASADDVATVQIALSRESIPAEELWALLQRYEFNHQLSSAIFERARELYPGDPVFMTVTLVHDIRHGAETAGTCINARYNPKASPLYKSEEVGAKRIAAKVLSAYHRLGYDA